MESNSNDVEGSAKSKPIEIIKDYAKYVFPKAYGASFVGAIAAGTVGQFNTGKPFRFIVTGAIGFGVLHTAFSTGTYLAHVGGVDADIGYSISGALCGCWVLTYRTKSIKNAIVGMGLGSLAGFAYNRIGSMLYTTSREAWLNTRAKTIQNSAYKTVSRSKPTFKPYAEMKREIEEEKKRKALENVGRDQNENKE